MSYKIKFPCNICGKEHERTVPNKSSAVQNLETGKKLAFCSATCRQQWHFEHRVVSIRVCINCKKEFSINPKKGNKLCSKECYSEDMKNNPENYGLLKRVEAMRSNIDKEAATKKMLQTKADRGLLIDWKLSEWKQYWRRCNDLTRKMRSVMLEGWDGYDYIDGEYIKDNLTLHFSHKNYPTLDHIVPRSQGFTQGIPPDQITCPENLGWTKRSNNSKKNNKMNKEQIYDLAGVLNKIPENTPERYQETKAKFLEATKDLQYLNGMLFYVEDNQLKSEVIVYKREHYDEVNLPFMQSGAKSRMTKEFVMGIKEKYGVDKIKI